MRMKKYTAKEKEVAGEEALKILLKIRRTAAGRGISLTKKEINDEIAAYRKETAAAPKNGSRTHSR